MKVERYRLILFFFLKCELFVCLFVFFMTRVDTSPVLFYFNFFIRSELVQVDPSWSKSIRVDPTRTAVQVDAVQLLYLPVRNTTLCIVSVFSLCK